MDHAVLLLLYCKNAYNNQDQSGTPRMEKFLAKMEKVSMEKFLVKMEKLMVLILGRKT